MIAQDLLLSSSCAGSEQVGEVQIISFYIARLYLLAAFLN